MEKAEGKAGAVLSLGGGHPNPVGSLLGMWPWGPSRLTGVPVDQRQEKAVSLWGKLGRQWGLCD